MRARWTPSWRWLLCSGCGRLRRRAQPGVLGGRSAGPGTPSASVRTPAHTFVSGVRSSIRARRSDARVVPNLCASQYLHAHYVHVSATPPSYHGIHVYVYNIHGKRLTNTKSRCVTVVPYVLTGALSFFSRGRCAWPFYDSKLPCGRSRTRCGRSDVDQTQSAHDHDRSRGLSAELSASTLISLTFRCVAPDETTPQRDSDAAETA